MELVERAHHLLNMQLLCAFHKNWWKRLFSAPVEDLLKMFIEQHVIIE